MANVVGLAVSLFLIGRISQGIAAGENDPCTNPAGKAGLCLPLTECPILSKLASAPTISINDNEFLKMSKCGADTKALVCCAGAKPKLGPRLPTPPECGQARSERSVPNVPDEHPWTARIQYRKPNGNFSFNCGGVLINSRYIITTAHCIKGIPNTWAMVGVRLGEFTSATDAAPVDFAVEKTIVHEEFNGTTKNIQNDVALIRLDRDVPFSNSVQPICLPVGQDVRARNNAGTMAVLAGWGRKSNAKLVKQQNIIDPNSCSTVYKRLGITLLDSQLCAGDVESTTDINCSLGGSPLVKLIGSNYFLVGVVSFGQTKCTTNTVPDVYSNLATYVDWVQSKLE